MSTGMGRGRGRGSGRGRGTGSGRGRGGGRGSPAGTQRHHRTHNRLRPEVSIESRVLHQIFEVGPEVLPPPRVLPGLAVQEQREVREAPVVPVQNVPHERRALEAHVLGDGDAGHVVQCVACGARAALGPAALVHEDAEPTPALPQQRAQPPARDLLLARRHHDVEAGEGYEAGRVLEGARGGAADWKRPGLPVGTAGGKEPPRQPQKRLYRRSEEVAKSVGGGYCWLQMPLSLALAVRGTVAGRWLGALEEGAPPPLPCIPGLQGRRQTTTQASAR